MSLKNAIRNAFGGRHKAALPPGTKAPEFSLKTTNGQQVSLEEALKKGPVLAAFFKVNCPTCQFTFPFLERLHERYGDSKLTLWGISQNDARDTRGFCKEFGIQFPILLDEDGYPASNQYGITNVPTLFLISSEGQIRETSVGFVKADLEKIAMEAARGTTNAFSPLFEPGEVIPESKPG
jgi:cytochrome c biogenesis protein CcmG/thiol:disulfide interchange protein DsbE